MVRNENSYLALPQKNFGQSRVPLTDIWRKILQISVVQTVNGINTTLATNDDWESQNSTVTFTAVEVRDLSTKAGAFTLPSGSKDAALLFSTSTNTSYTVLVSGANGETGVALVEVYDVTGL